MALYMAKERGRNRVHALTHDDKDLADQRQEMNWVSHLTQAIEEKRFILYFQSIKPIQNQSQGKHFEILVRLRDKNDYIISPGQFIPAAERYSLMSSIDELVIKGVFLFLAENQNRQDEIELCSINLSATSLGREDFHHFVIEKFSESKFPAHKICFEITESAAISNLDSAIEFIESLSSLGCQIALDDFGTGMSSFGYLKRLPVNYLKIDGSFVKEIHTDLTSRSMVRAIADVGKEMGMRTIAEFVENKEILKVLTDLGVDYAQGYHIDKPQPLDNLFTPKIIPLHRAVYH